MSIPVPVPSILVAAFFDAPGLLAVRFAHRSAINPVVNFAISRRPDANAAGCLSSIGGFGSVIGIGLVVAFVGLPLMRGCSWSSNDSTPTIAEATPGDCRQGTNWQVGLDRLGDEFTPSRSDLRPWAMRALLDVPRELARSGDPTGGWLRPRCSTTDRRAFSQGARLATVLTEAGSGNDLAVILDLPGPVAVAAAAGMASRFEPVFTIDNLPHPSGVVPSAQTLAAVVYWRPEFSVVSAYRPAGAGPMFVLEGERLTPYRNEVDRFDNRSVVRLPDATQFKALGITRILYVRQQRGQVSEADDLNNLFVALSAAGVEVRHLALEAMDDPALAQPAPATTAPTPATPQSYWFWQRYGWYRPAGLPFTDPLDSDARYRTAPRPTLFSSGSGIPSSLDGGARAHDEVFSRLTPGRATSSWDSDGGSWSRSYGSSCG